MTGRAAAVVALVAGLCLVPVVAHAQNEQSCKAELAARKFTGQTSGKDCTALAGLLLIELGKDEAAVLLAPDPVGVANVFSQRELQNRNAQQADLSGTAAQGHAVPGVQPAGVAAGTIAALGTRAGQDAIAALAVNPATLFLAEQASEQLARLSRIADITVFVPVSGTDDDSSASDSDDFRYIGARLRFNFTGAAAGSTIWNRADELLKARISGLAVASTMLVRLLTAAPDKKACADAVLAKDRARILAACGGSFDFTPDLAAAAALHDELARVRRAADAKYLGVDVRFDFGDPTLGAVENARGKFLFAGIAAGRRFIGAGAASSGIRARLGLRHAALDSATEAEFAAEGGVGAELTRRIGEDELNLSAAFEFRHGNAPATLEDQFQTNFTMIRGALSIPITSGNSLTINVGKPLSGTVSPIFSVNFNWGLLLSDRPLAAMR